MQAMGELPIHAAFYEPKPQLVNPIRYEILLEFVFLALFLSLMFGCVFLVESAYFCKANDAFNVLLRAK